jgi:tyrosyl-tRNA synthetase
MLKVTSTAHNNSTATCLPGPMSRRFNNLSIQSASLSYICPTCRTRLAVRSSRPSTETSKRWITRNHMRRIKDADVSWGLRADKIETGEKQSMLGLLEERGYINQIIGGRDALDSLLTQRRVGAYVGIDPTAPSIHVGHMVPLMALGWMFIHGYAVTFLVGVQCRTP